MTDTERCHRCYNRLGDRGDEGWSVLCWYCERYYPPAVVKSFVDPFYYVLKLRTGELVVYESATCHGEYIRLRNLYQTFTSADIPASERIPFPCHRGLDVRVSDIVWASDAAGYDS